MKNLYNALQVFISQKFENFSYKYTPGMWSVMPFLCSDMTFSLGGQKQLFSSYSFSSQEWKASNFS